MKNFCAERDRKSVCLSDNGASLKSRIELFEKKREVFLHQLCIYPSVIKTFH